MRELHSAHVLFFPVVCKSRFGSVACPVMGPVSGDRPEYVPPTVARSRTKARIQSLALVCPLHPAARTAGSAAANRSLELIGKHAGMFQEGHVAGDVHIQVVVHPHGKDTE